MPSRILQTSQGLKSLGLKTMEGDKQKESQSLIDMKVGTLNEE